MAPATEIPPVMRVVRAGFAPMKGTRHLALDEVELDEHGPVGDREWCLVELECDRVLRTSSNPLLGVTVRAHPGGLCVTTTDGRTASAGPGDAGEARTVDYWGRPASVTLHPGPVGTLLSEVLGRRVELALTSRGAVVYGAPVSVIGTASLADLARRMGRAEIAEQSARFRSTFVVDTDEPWIEDTWVGHEVELGDAVVRMAAPIGRCGVVNLDPGTGRRDGSVLKELANFRPANGQGEPFAAVDAVVVAPGTVSVGAPVWIRPAHPRVSS